MMRHDDAMLDSVAALALGVLPRDEAQATADHVRSCAECRALYAELRPVADVVGLAADAPDPDRLAEARRKSRIMDAVRASSPSPADVGAGTAAGTETARRTGRSWLGPALGAVAALVAIAIGIDDANVRGDREQYVARERSFTAKLADSDAARRRADSQVLALVGPGTRRYDVPQGQVATSGGRIYIAIAVPPVPRGKVYQAWTLRAGAKAVAPSITFTPDARGVAIVELPQRATGIAAVAVSVEPVGGSKAPTTTPKFIRKLS